MKNIYLSFVFALLSAYVFGQQIPHYSMYMLNDVIINPALISSKNENQITLMVRDQWTGFEGAPKTQSISYYNVDNPQYGKGISIVNDVTGPISILKGNISGSTLVKEKFKHELSLGASLNVFQYQFRNSDIILEDDGIIDPVIDQSTTDKLISGSASFGVNYFSDKFNIGFSTLNLISRDLNISSSNISNKLISNYYLNASYQLSNNPDFLLTPSLTIKKIGATNPQLDINFRSTIKNSLWGGISYRTEDAVIAMLGLFYENYNIAYSYDFTTTNMNTPSYGSHAIVVTYSMDRKLQDKDRDGIIDEEDQCPELPGTLELNGCPDTDGDGIIDSEDDCPFIPGLVINKGCPDTDGDGITDKYDLCPEVPGLKKLNGCPDADGDGIHDELDDCPEVFGPKTNNGCPEDSLSEGKDVNSINPIQSPEDFLSELAKRIHFEFDSFKLDENSKIILDIIARYLNNNSQIGMEILGHTDQKGSNKYNDKLSLKRAKSVYKYLIKQNVNKSRLFVKSFGENQLAGDIDQYNRRVEFKVIDFK